MRLFRNHNVYNRKLRLLDTKTIKMKQEVSGIWTNFQKELSFFIQKRTQDSNATADILQEVFIKVIEKIDMLNQTKNLRQYLYAMVRNAIVDHHRQQKPLLSEGKIPAAVFTEETTEDLNTLIAACCIRPFINQLAPKYKEALTLSELEQLPQTELARQLGISYSGAKSRVQRGREQLKEQLLQCCQLESDTYGNLTEMKSNNCNCS